MPINQDSMHIFMPIECLMFWDTKFLEGTHTHKHTQ